MRKYRFYCLLRKGKNKFATHFTIKAVDDAASLYNINDIIYNLARFEHFKILQINYIMDQDEHDDLDYDLIKTIPHPCEYYHVKKYYDVRTKKVLKYDEESKTSEDS